VADQGAITVITKHGQPYAALVAVIMAGVKGRGLPTSHMALKSSTVGSWGEDSARTITELQDQ
jgi:antitoxin (DNA-binding transcriptional repressor) of toxin-antitoxin stability system